MCFSCSSGPRSTAKLAIDSIEPSVKNRQNFCGRSNTSGRKAPASTNMQQLRRRSATKCFQRWREANGSPSPNPERKGIVLRLSRLLLLLGTPRLQSKENCERNCLDESSAIKGVLCCQRAAVTPGQTRPSRPADMSSAPGVSGRRQRTQQRSAERAEKGCLDQERTRAEAC